MKEITLDLKKRDVTIQNMETLTYEELETKTYRELQEEFYEKPEPKQKQIRLTQPIKEVKL